MSSITPDIRTRAILDIVGKHFPAGSKNAQLEHCLDQWKAGRHLTYDEARGVFDSLMGDASVTDYQIGAFLAYAIPERLNEDETAGFASVLREKASHVVVRAGEQIGDTCGTGGDTFPTFNISTTVMFVLAGGGIKIAKHGNRAFTSKCGSADVLQELGIAIELGPEQVRECIAEVGLGFMFAPQFHPATKRVQHIRRLIAGEMPPGQKLKTVFNVLGPLSNPANASWQMMGVYDEEFVPKLARVMRKLGLVRGLLFHGHSGEPGESHEKGLDEVSTLGPTAFAELKGGAIGEYRLTPEAMGLQRAKPAALAGGDVARNAQILRDVLSGATRGPMRDVVLANAAVGLYLGRAEARSLADSVRDYVAEAGRIIDSGGALKKLDDLRAATQRLAASRPRP